MSTFDKVSSQYQQQSLVQQAAAEKLLAMLNIGAKDDVLDVACGPGHITQRIKSITQGRVVGTDISAGMIAQAKAKYPGVDFRHLAAESLDYHEDFDVVFCNSAVSHGRAAVRGS
jgi:ubiquinone/menaquinone biosynthesis C-methylase UbiE